MKQAELPSEGKMASFELNLKSGFDTTSTVTVAILALVVVLLVAWKYRKSIKQFVKYGRFKILPQPCDRSRKLVPEEHEDNYSEVLFSFNLRFLAWCNFCSAFVLTKAF